MRQADAVELYLPGLFADELSPLEKSTDLVVPLKKGYADSAKDAATAGSKASTAYDMHHAAKQGILEHLDAVARGEEAPMSADAAAKRGQQKYLDQKAKDADRSPYDGLDKTSNTYRLVRAGEDAHYSGHSEKQVKQGAKEKGLDDTQTAILCGAHSMCKANDPR